MKSAAIAALRVELEAAREVLLPQVQGLVDLKNIPFFTSSAMAEIEQELADHKRRLLLINEGLAALDSLEADGYPEMPLNSVPLPVMNELNAQLAAIEAAIDEFAADAVSVIITPGEPVDK